MYNIIRGVPLVGYDPRAKQAMLFMSGACGMPTFYLLYEGAA
jgi:hypothetical protein